MPSIPYNKKKKKGSWTRDPKIVRLYKLARWERTRQAHFNVSPLCVGCQKEGKYTYATRLDHIIPVSTYKTLEQLEQLFWDSKNHQGLCEHHHKSKTSSESHKNRK